MLYYETTTDNTFAQDRGPNLPTLQYPGDNTIFENDGKWNGENIPFTFKVLSDEYIVNVPKGSFTVLIWPNEIGQGTQPYAKFKYYEDEDGAIFHVGTQILCQEPRKFIAVYDERPDAETIEFVASRGVLKNGLLNLPPDPTGVRPLKRSPLTITVAIKDADGNPYEGKASYIWDRTQVLISGDIDNGGGTLTISQTDALISLRHPLNIHISTEDSMAATIFTIVCGVTYDQREGTPVDGEIIYEGV